VRERETERERERATKTFDVCDHSVVLLYNAIVSRENKREGKKNLC